MLARRFITFSICLFGELLLSVPASLDAADQAVEAIRTIHDRALAARAYTARAKAHRALGDQQAAAADLQRAQQVKAKIQ